MGSIEKYHAEGIYPSKVPDMAAIESLVESFIHGVDLRFHKMGDGTMVISDCAGVEVVVASSAEIIRTADQYADALIDYIDVNLLFTLSDPRAQVYRELKRQLRQLLSAKWNKCRLLGCGQPAAQPKPAPELRNN